MAERGVPSPALPPSYVWKIKRGDRVETPIDSRGIVDVPATVDLVRSLVDEGYPWEPELGLHHFVWPKFLYPWENRRPNPYLYSNLPPHKGIMPREFENFLHEVTVHPRLPQPEVMHYRIEAWSVANSLFIKAREVVQLERMMRREKLRRDAVLAAEGFDGSDPVGEDLMQTAFEENFRWYETMNPIFERHLRGVDTHLERNAQIPAEFRFFDSEAPISVITGQIGRIAVPRSMKLNKSIAA